MIPLGNARFYEKAIFYIDPLQNSRGGRRGPKKFDKNFFLTLSLIFVPKGIQIHLGRLTFLKKGFFEPPQYWYQEAATVPEGSWCLYWSHHPFTIISRPPSSPRVPLADPSSHLVCLVSFPSKVSQVRAWRFSSQQILMEFQQFSCFSEGSVSRQNTFKTFKTFLSGKHFSLRKRDPKWLSLRLI